MTLMDTLFDADALEGPGPGGRSWTRAQRAAIEERSRSVLVSANAGSGKTSVLVERFVGAVREDGVDPARILAITFTDKAAGELRERLRARFLDLGDREAARATEGAFVATIHGFCARLLRAHAVTAGLDPAFTVLDEPRAARLRDRAFADALRGFLRDGGRAELDLVAAHSPDGLRRTIAAVHDELRSQGHARPRLPAVAARPAPDAEREALRRAHAAFAAELAGAGDGKTVDAARDALDACARLLEDLESGMVPWPGRLAALAVMCGKTAALSTDTCRAYVDARAAFERACADHHAGRAVPLLDALLERYGAAYAAAKARRGALDFDDLELGARALLEAHPGVRRSWAERFALIMVDEFQDTNRRQLALLEALERDNGFTVGDEFQSIYGFRHADVEIFRARRGTLGAGGAALELAENFRSRPEILAPLNAAFLERFGDRFVPLVAARPPAGDGPRVELLLTDQRGWADVELGDTLPGGQPWRRAEARLVAQRVRELVDAGEARPGQVAVLVRATAAMPLFDRALADVGLPTLATAGRGFWSRQEVVHLSGYLAALANPLHERALVGTLASPLAGVSADGLAVAMAAAREAGRDLWWMLEATFAGEEPEAAWRSALEPGDEAALGAFVPRFAAERRRAPRLSLDALLERAISSSDYDLHALGLLNGARRMANIDKLLRLARDFEAAEGRDLRGFVDHAAALEQAQRREPEAPVEDPDEDAVRLMTIHAAKGLEFDVVVAADLGRRGNLGQGDLLVAGDKLGLRLSLLDGAKPTPALDYVELKDRRQLAEAEEEDRVLYVALTRARERLIVSGSVRDPEKWPENAPGAPPIAWLAPALVPGVAQRLCDAAPDSAVEARGEVRVLLNAPATLGAALGDAFRAPGAEGLEAAAATVPATGAVEELAPQLASGALSYTALTAYARCGYRFYAQRVLGLPDVAPPAAPAPPREGLSARERGVLVHALIEELDFAAGAAPRPARAGELAGRLGLAAGERDLERACELAGAFAGGGLAARLAAARDVRREHEFAFELAPGAGPLLTGVVDLLAIEADGTWLVVDAKTDVVRAADDLAAIVEADYGVQRDLYALAALRAGAPAVEVVYAFLGRPDDPVARSYAVADEPALAARLAALTDRIAAGDFAPTAFPHANLCATCPARDRLCPHPRELKLR